MNASTDSGIRSVSSPDLRKRVLTDCLQASARLYMFFAKETLATFDEAGEAAVRDSIRRYGVWRGSEMRQAHAALGEKINVETLIRRWDSASTYVAKDEVSDQGNFAPNDVSFDVSYCPASLAWKEDGFHRWGHVYCDEFHQSAATAYHPDAMVVIPINMMKGDHHCEFRWAMPNVPADDEPSELAEVTKLGLSIAPLYERTDDEDEGMRLALTRTNRLLAGRYMTFMQALFAHHDEKAAREVAVRALTAWAHDRGSRLVNRLSRGAADQLTAHSVWEQTDLAPDFTWGAQLVDSESALLEAEISQTPLDDLWSHYGTEDWAELFWQVSLPAYFAELYPAAKIDVVTLPEQASRLSKLVISGSNR